MEEALGVETSLEEDREWAEAVLDSLSMGSRLEGGGGGEGRE